MKARELVELSVEELDLKERELKRKMFNLRFQRATSELDNTAELAKTRRDIARVMTVAAQRRAQEAGR
ncbi:MAG: 50S ribosomal protein L29 [Candidatus Bipolaricaulia bacterium]